jgi:sirohydrochlorin cobaltochelatase
MLEHNVPSTLRGARPAQARGGDASHAVMLVGHGSLRAGAGAAMIRLARAAQQHGLAPIVTAGFLNYSRPAFAEALDRVVAAGAAEVVVQPYFLVPGTFVSKKVPMLIEAGAAAHPTTALRLARPFGDHPALARLVLQRALEADYRAGLPKNPDLLPGQSLLHTQWQSSYTHHATGLVLMAHGSPDDSSNTPIRQVAERVRAGGHFAKVTTCFLDLNEPRIPEAIDAQFAAGVEQIVAVPYFLQLGNHVHDDLPAEIEAARARHPRRRILLSEHLAYDRLLLPVIADRVAEARHARAYAAG